ncbi:MAG: hypothetical protein KBC50_00615 [Candidatus Pacebacteria bacterium]|jgi:hypothetical protein|nr:hypothetical protein [Candidatus Paceibacterota bacterium]
MKTKMINYFVIDVFTGESTHEMADLYVRNQRDFAIFSRDRVERALILKGVINSEDFELMKKQGERWKVSAEPAVNGTLSEPCLECETSVWVW